MRPCHTSVERGQTDLSKHIGYIYIENICDTSNEERLPENPSICYFGNLKLSIFFMISLMWHSSMISIITNGSISLKLMFSCKFRCIDCVYTLNIIQISIGLQISYPNATISPHQVLAFMSQVKLNWRWVK